MAELFDLTANTLITNAVESCESADEINQVLNYARDGTVYLQIIGSPRKAYDVICHATRIQEALLESAWASGNLLRVTMSYDGTTRIAYGRIIELDKDYIGNRWDGTEWEDYYKLTLKLAYSPAPT